MKGKQIVAIDVGSTNVVIAVGAVEDDGRIDILGITSEPVQGVNAGRVENSETVGRAVRAAKERIEKQLGITITEAYAGLSGDFIRCVQVTDHVYVQDDQNNGCNQITERDLESLHRRMQSVKLPDDKEEIITKEPLRYKADNKEVAEPVGAYGHVLSGTYNFILADHTMRERLLHCLLKQDITVKKFVPNALVSHIGVATTEDMEEGAVVINLGGGITDIAVLSLGGVVTSSSIHVGGDTFDDAIIRHLRRKHNLLIGERTAEELKIKLGSAFPYEEETTMDVKGRNLVDGLPKNIVISAEEVREALADPVGEIVDAVKSTLERTPPELSADIIDNGIMLTGGGALLRGLDTLINRETGMPVHVAENPLDCVVNGTGKCLDLGMTSNFRSNRR